MRNSSDCVNADKLRLVELVFVVVAVVGASGEGQGARLDSQARWTLSRLAEKLADCEGAEWVAAECIALAELR